MFNAAVFLMGLLGRDEIAAHTIAIQIAALAFMLPLVSLPGLPPWWHRFVQTRL